MIEGARYAHTNLIARDWRSLAAFYERFEIYSYSVSAPGPPPAVNRPGFAHLAFEVRSVEDARRDVLAAGGGTVGDVVTLTTAAGRRVTWCYVSDPEGNVLELQSWS